MYFCGHSASYCGGWYLSGIYSDYGNTAVFFHGFSTTDPGSSCQQIAITNSGPNGGGRDPFGSIRLECVTDISITGPFFTPDAVNPSSVTEIVCVAICDGGPNRPNPTTTFTRSITLSGGNYTAKRYTDLLIAAHPSAVSIGVLIDGSGVQCVSIVGIGVDTEHPDNSFPIQFINGASAANGITMLYGDAGGQFVVQDSTGTFPIVAGNVTGPSSAVDGDLALFDGTSGAVISDSGVGLSDLVLQGGNATVGLLVATGALTCATVTYAGGGAVQMRFDIGNLGLIQITTVSSTLSLSPSGSGGLVSGRWQLLTITNTLSVSCAFAVNGSWAVSGTMPSEIGGGVSITLMFQVFGTAESDVKVAVIAS